MNRFPQRFIFLAFLLLLPQLAPLFADNSDPALFEAPWRRANEAYLEHRFDEAREMYENLLRQNFRAPEIYYNLGNAYYHLGERGKAAWMYEKALDLAPRFDPARRNLRLIRSGIAAPENGSFFLFKPLEWLCGSLAAGEWAAILLASSLMASVALAGWLLLRPGRARRFSRNLAVCAFALAAVSAAFFVPRYISVEWRQYAVIITPDAIVRNAPNPQGEPYFEAAEGERFIFEESDRAGWMWVKHPATGRVGYLPETALGKIREEKNR